METGTKLGIADIDAQDFQLLIRFLKASARPDTSARDTEELLMTSLSLAIRRRCVSA